MESLWSYRFHSGYLTSPYGLLFDEEKLRQSPGFIELLGGRHVIGESVEAVAECKVWVD
jgi:hypothetical protein